MRRRNPPPRDTNVCLNCGVDITHMRHHAKFCTTSCSMKHWHREHPGHRRWYMTKTMYGIDREGFDTLFSAQGNRCAICRTEQPEGQIAQWNIDHDHVTGAVRGILCSPCNIGIGQLRDDPNLLRKAIAYLEREPG
jgi:hypothetical protein